MDIYSKPIDQITYEDIRLFLESRHPESEILDYKKELANGLQHLIAALANTTGGIILLGVQEKDGRPVIPACGVDCGNGPDEWKRRVSDIAYDNIYPPLFPETAACPINDNPQKVVVLIRVVESTQTPHATDDRQRIYVRIKSHNRFVESQAPLERLEWLWDRRRRSVELRDQLIGRARQVARFVRSFQLKGQTEDKTGAAVIEICAVPCFPGPPGIELRQLLSAQNVRGSCRNRLYAETTGTFPMEQHFRLIDEGVLFWPGLGTPGRFANCAQINRWGLVHSTVYIFPTAVDRVMSPAIFGQWIVAHFDAFLAYHQVFHQSVGTSLSGPVLLRVRLTAPPDFVLLMSEPRSSLGKEEEFQHRFLLSDLSLFEGSLLPEDIGDQRDTLVKQLIDSLLWAGGYSGADRISVDQVLSI
jgi:hypothetical protein